jgi:hypothetical protein
MYILTYQGEEGGYVNYKTWIPIGTWISSPLGYNNHRLKSLWTA